ncbi:MAG TPA: right-handed parallel beta-helix repeat-containing protein [Candidatus Limiplasma pullicola]|nr:right-handed parallel beta-helix repeat-containing protein [Candidatus Limiplasma pullicola]
MHGKRKILIWLIMITIVAMIPVLSADASGSEKTLTFKEFLQEVVDRKGNFDGGGVLVRWEPNEAERKIDRIQSNNAQYQIFSELDDITLSNINFEYVPADIFEHTDAWAGPGNWFKEKIRNAEFQFLNKGNVTLKNCTFEKVIASPFGDQQNRSGDAERSLTVTNCTFSNVYNAYALKDIYPANARIEDNRFVNCSGAIYLEGKISRETIYVSKNRFDNIDQYAESGKENTRGIIQLSAGFTTGDSTQIILKDNTITGNLVKDKGVEGGLPVLRQIADLDGMEIGGWTPGEAFSIKAEAEGAYALPSMPDGTDGKINYRFAGWAATNVYLGATDITNKSRFLAAGDQVTENGMYYAVWEATSCTVIYSDGAGGAVFADQVFTVVPGDATPRFNGTPQREGYLFMGWQPTLSATVTENTIYTAVWEAIKPTPTPTTSAAPPKTGDGSALGTWIGLLLLGAGGMAGLALHMKKRKS